MTFSEFYTAEQNNLIRYVKTLVGANPTYAKLYYQGVIAGSEFLTYNAKKLYIAFELSGFYVDYGAMPPAYILLYDQTNATSSYITYVSMTWNTTQAAMNYVSSSFTEHNIYFSRVTQVSYANIRFNGIKVTWP